MSLVLMTPFSTQASVKWKQMTLNVCWYNVSSALAVILASTASIIMLTEGDLTEKNYPNVGSAVTTM